MRWVLIADRCLPTAQTKVSVTSEGCDDKTGVSGRRVVPVDRWCYDKPITGLVFSAPYVNARQTDHGWGFPGNRPGSLSSLFLDLRWDSDACLFSLSTSSTPPSTGFCLFYLVVTCLPSSKTSKYRPVRLQSNSQPWENFHTVPTCTFRTLLAVG